MLMLSADATQAIKKVIASTDTGENGGLRFSVKPVDEERAKLELSLAPSPQPGDVQIEQEGAQVFLEERAVPFLEDKILDAQIDGDGTAFTILDQTTGGLPN